MDFRSFPPEVIFEIAKDFDIDHLYSLCETDKFLNTNTCGSSEFWKAKIRHDFKETGLKELKKLRNEKGKKALGDVKELGRLWKSLVKTHKTGLYNLNHYKTMCKDLNDNLYKDELQVIAVDLGYYIPKGGSSKQKMCEHIVKVVSNPKFIEGVKATNGFSFSNSFMSKVRGDNAFRPYYNIMSYLYGFRKYKPGEKMPGGMYGIDFNLIPIYEIFKEKDPSMMAEYRKISNPIRFDKDNVAERDKMIELISHITPDEVANMLTRLTVQEKEPYKTLDFSASDIDELVDLHRAIIEKELDPNLEARYLVVGAPQNF